MKERQSQTLDLIMTLLAALIIAAGIGVYFIWWVIPWERNAGTQTALSDTGTVTDTTEEEQTPSLPDIVLPDEARQESDAPGWEDVTTEGSVTFHEVRFGTRVDQVEVFIREGHGQESREEGDRVSLDENGRITKALKDGPYTVTWSAEGYYDGSADIMVQDGKAELHQNLVPLITGQEAYVVLEWQGEDDLDLCLFNTTTGQYVSIISPTDDHGNFLYADNAVPVRCEVIRIANAVSADALTIFVRDGEDLRPVAVEGHSADAVESEGSRMEEDGVHVSVYTAEGRIFRCTAFAFESAALWSPGYLYQGRVEEPQRYVYDRTQYEWAMYDKNDPSTFSMEPIRLSEEQQQLMMRVSYALYQALPKRQYFSPAQIREQLASDPARMERFLWYVYYGYGYAEYDGEGGGVVYHFSDIAYEEADRLLYDLFGLRYDFTQLPHDMIIGGSGILCHESRMSAYSAPRNDAYGPVFNGYADYRSTTDIAVFGIRYETGEENGRIYVTLKRCDNSFGFDIIGCQVLDPQQ